MNLVHVHYYVTTEADLAAVESVFETYFQDGFVVHNPRCIMNFINQGSWDAHHFDISDLQEERLYCEGYLTLQQAGKIEELLKIDLSRVAPNGIFQREIEPEKDWLALWQSNLKVQHLSSRIQVVPEGVLPKEPRDICIYITPGLGFGSGEHETTCMAASFLEDNLKIGQSVVDVGCGSGILAIAAKKLGAGVVYACDHDHQAIISSSDNIARNEVEIEVSWGDLLIDHDKKYDVILANLVTDIIIRLIPMLEKNLLPGGFVVLSGIHRERIQEILDILDKEQYYCLALKEGTEWASMLVKQRQEAK